MKFTDNDGKITLVEWLSIVYYIFLLSFFLRWRKDREIYHHVMLLGVFPFLSAASSSVLFKDHQ